MTEDNVFKTEIISGMFRTKWNATQQGKMEDIFDFYQHIGVNSRSKESDIGDLLTVPQEINTRKLTWINWEHSLKAHSHVNFF